MKYTVHGVRHQVISVEIDADSPEEALGQAIMKDPDWVDVWDSDYEFTFAVEAH